MPCFPALVPMAVGENGSGVALRRSVATACPLLYSDDGESGTAKAPESSGTGHMPRVTNRSRTFADVRERMSKGRPASPPGTSAILRVVARPPDRRTSPANASFPVVGVGASAGGLDAFRQLLAHVPADAGLALVLVQHLEPKRASLLSDALGRATRMKVAQAEDGVRVEPNRVYVIPPGAQMAIEQGVLRLSPRCDDARAGRTSPSTISSARWPPSAAGSPSAWSSPEPPRTGRRGWRRSGRTAGSPSRRTRARRASAGCRRARSRQAWSTTACPCPRWATSSPGWPATPISPGGEPAAPTPRGAARWRRIFGLVRADLRRRLQRVQAGDLQAAARPADGGSQGAGHRRVSGAAPGRSGRGPGPVRRPAHPGHLVLPRQGGSFEELKAIALPEDPEAQGRGAPIRAWVVGCSTGEEVYSLAMSSSSSSATATSVHPVLDLRLGRQREGDRARARGALLRGRRCARSARSAGAASSSRPSGASVSSKALRDLCVFVRHDVARDPPFSKLDLVSCRNVLIYFGQALQKRVLAGFHHSLNQPGYLLLGRSESVSSAPRLFAPATASGKLFARRPWPSTFRLAPRAGAVPFAHGPLAGETAERTRTEGALAQQRGRPDPGALRAARSRRQRPAGDRPVPRRARDPISSLRRESRQTHAPQDGPRPASAARCGSRSPRRGRRPRRVRGGGHRGRRDGSGRTCDIVVLPSQAPRPRRRSRRSWCSSRSARPSRPGARARRRGLARRCATRPGRVPAARGGARLDQGAPRRPHRGARPRERRARVRQRRSSSRQRGAPEHERGARDGQGGAPGDERGAHDGERRAPRPQPGAAARERRPREPPRTRSRSPSSCSTRTVASGASRRRRPRS